MRVGVVGVRGSTGKESRGVREENPLKVWSGSEGCGRSMAVLEVSSDILLGTRLKGGPEYVGVRSGSEVGGRRSGLGSERGLGEAISNASSYTPVSSICKGGIGARLSLTGVGRRACRTEFGVRRRLVLRRRVA